MAKDLDTDSRNLSRTETNTSAITFSGSQSLLIPNTSQNRYSLPVPIPERSVSIPYDSLPISPVSSTPPRLDLLPDLALDGLQRSSTFRDGLEKAVNDINTKYGDSSKPFINSTSPTNSIAIRDNNTFKPRYMVPIYVDTPNAPNVRPAIGELWTTLMSQPEPLLPPSRLEAGQDVRKAGYPSKESRKFDVKCYKEEKIHMPVVGEEVEISEESAFPSHSGRESSATILSVTEKDDDDASAAPTTDFEDTDVEINTKSVDRTSVPVQAKAVPEPVDHGSLSSHDTVSTSVASQRMSQGHSSSATAGSTDDEDDSSDTQQTSGSDRVRNSSAPSVAALVSKFRRMAQSPDQTQQTDDTQDQDQASVGSNSKFIQSYRQRSEDGENEDSLLSAASTDTANETRTGLRVC
ncbi:hypothetical protein NLG97_g8631 [Lecanicillium saksenae]|uniref:Uncharacterized protein n=1 Tax=Lecanicillium saksenae TaxID=468837 RepID=A0ACC1QKQ7_9HYPO|nr:hypothetical protein NLG97_g8631 [Lecanicillium saksenae]